MVTTLLYEITLKTSMVERKKHETEAEVFKKDL